MLIVTSPSSAMRLMSSASFSGVFVIFIEYIDFGFVGQGEQISVFIWQFSRQVEILSVFLLGLVSDKRLIEDTVARVNDLVTILTT